MSSKTKESTTIEMIEVDDHSTTTSFISSTPPPGAIDANNIIVNNISSATITTSAISSTKSINSLGYVDVDITSTFDINNIEDVNSNEQLHTLSEEKICQFFKNNPDRGLSSDEANRRTKVYGPNKLDPPKTNYLKKLFFYTFGSFNGVLWCGVIVFFLCWRPPLSNPPNVTNLALAILVLLVIFLQCFFGAFQDWSTSRVMNSILDMLPSECLVVRDGFIKMMPSKLLVPGDIVHLKLGNKIPADLMMLQSNDLKVDNSVITGESKPVTIGTKCTDKSMTESKNVCFMGTNVVNGCGMGIVLRTGNNTMMGKISKLTNSGKEKQPLIQKEINRFVGIIVCLTILLAIILVIEWCAWLRIKYPDFMNVPSMLSNVMSCIVAFIPEGMPISVALTLLVIAKRMKANNILPKSLKVVETLGVVDLILSDKTGTLTQNRMFVTTVAFLDSILTPDQCCATLSSENSSSAACVYQQVLLASSLCNNSTLAPPPEDQREERQVIGDATDVAIFKFGQKLSNSLPVDIRTPYVRVFDIPFNSKNKWMLALHQISNMENKKKAIFGEIPFDSHVLHVKGAPDVILPMCSSILSTETNTALPLNESNLMHIQAIQQQLASNGQRVLMLARRFYTPRGDVRGDEFQNEIETKGLVGLTIIGLLGIMDPPRSDILETVQQCRMAGIRFFMVTGDFSLTASSIARQVGIFTNDPSISPPDSINDILLNDYRDDNYFAIAKETNTVTSLCLSGPELNKLEDSHWDTISKYQEVVFARTTPEQKLLIVKQFQKRDSVVGVTGDGVNDCPALKAADVGIAVASENGSDVAIESADLVLLGSFNSIVNAIRLGRLVFQNLQKVISYLLPAGSFSEITPVIVNSFFGTPLPLNSFLMIIICCFTDLFLSLSLIMEKEEIDLLKTKPRNAKKDHLITFKIYIQSYLFMGVLQSVISIGMFFSFIYEYTGLSFKELVFSFGSIDYSKGHVSAEDFTGVYVPIGNSVVFITLVILQWGNLLAIRNRRLSCLNDPIRKKRRNPYLFLSMIASLSVALIVTKVHWIQHLFGTGDVPIKYWLLPIPFAVIIFLLDEIRKFFSRTFPNGPIAKISW